MGCLRLLLQGGGLKGLAEGSRGERGGGLWLRWRLLHEVEGRGLICLLRSRLLWLYLLRRALVHESESIRLLLVAALGRLAVAGHLEGRRSLL